MLLKARAQVKKIQTVKAMFGAEQRVGVVLKPRGGQQAQVGEVALSSAYTLPQGDP